MSTSLVSLNPGNGYTTTVTISAIDDAVVDGEQAFSITTGNSISGDAAYDGHVVPDIVGFTCDNDVAAVAVTPVPTLGEWARMGLVLMLMGAGLAFMRRRAG